MCFQKLEREKGESQKVVTTEYSGLIGKLINPKEEVIEGYNPVIPEVVPEKPATVESNPEEVIVSTPSSNTPNPIPSTVIIIPAPVPSTETVSPTLPSASESTSTTTPTGVIDEELVQEVVEELLQNQATPVSESATSTP